MKLSTACIALLLQVGVAAGEGGILRNLWGNKKQDQKQADGQKEAQARALKVRSNASPVARRRRLANGGPNMVHAEPCQEFYIPLPENDVFEDMFRKINPNKNSNGDYYVRGDMVSLISVAISTDKTVIWYDHWEDSYEADIINPQSSDTQIWGDGIASNGCRPDVNLCTDRDDYLNAGDSFVIENSMNIPRLSNNWHNDGLKYDGGDRLHTSFPVTITRGEYAQYPGSLLAGAVEVLDVSNWGKEFEAPIGYDTSTSTDAFSYTRLFIMSATNANRVMLPNGKQAILQQGASLSIDVKQGEKISSSEPVQVFLCTGDVGSTYELRWYSLLPTAQWADEYMTPVGDSFGRTKMVLYNPNNSDITIRFTWLNDSKNEESENYTIQPGQNTFTRVIPTGSGAKVSTNDGKFIALSLTDSEVRAGTHDNEKRNEYLGGQAFDWGFPVMPTIKLTPQVLVGWGYGCTANDCQGKTERSAVWVSPVADADIYVDYQNTGGGYSKIFMKKLESKMFRDTTDHDMSGAVIFATQPGTGYAGPPVDIASAWGQDPAVSRDTQSISLDLGTVVLPFPSVRVQKSVDKTVASPDDILTYKITVQNVGQKHIPAGGYTIVDPLDGTMEQGTYVQGSTMYGTYTDDGDIAFSPIADEVANDATGVTPFPLDGAGLPSQRELPRRGGVHIIKFQVKVDPEKVDSDSMVNTGHIKLPLFPNLPFEATTKIGYDAHIRVENVVYIGENGEMGCNDGHEEVRDVMGKGVTYCFKVTNTGRTHLDRIKLTNGELGYTAEDFGDIPKLGPNESFLVTKTGKINGNKKNTVKAVGTPVFHSGADIGIPDVASTDPSGVTMVSENPSIEIQNTVFKNTPRNPNPLQCNVMGGEEAFGKSGAPVMFCFKVTNTGNTPLTNVKIENPALSYTKLDVGDLAAGETKTFSADRNITETKDNVATAKGTPCRFDGTGGCTPITELPEVVNSDPSKVYLQLDTDSRSGDKTLPPKTCMQTNWEDAGNSQNLVCRAKEVYLEFGGIKTERQKCKPGEMITVNIEADIHFNAARYDPGWYVATDGGDALVGECAIGGLMNTNTYQVRSGKDADDSVGSVAWNSDHKGHNDNCGDIMMDGGGGCNILVPFLVDTQIKCVDDNDNGMMDMSVCFSWRTKGTDDTCTLEVDDLMTQGELPDLYPGTPSKCFCARYDVPDITVDNPGNETYVSPC